jgi:hypothetical protein
LRDVGEAPRSVVRERRPPKKFLNYMALMSSIIDAKPSSFEEATYQQVWWDAMVEEYTSIMRNDVWDIVSRPEGKSVVSSKWLYKIKHVVDGSIDNFKVRFVARGFSQKEGVDYKEKFSPFKACFYLSCYFYCFSYEVEDTSYGCENNVPQHGIIEED